MTVAIENNFWPIIHALIYCPHHSGKSTMAATFPKPMLVMMYDALGKDLPYLKVGSIVSKVQKNEHGTPFRDVKNEKGDLLIRLEYYHNIDPERPVAIAQSFKRYPGLMQEMHLWKTIVLDSVTSFEFAARTHSKYLTNPNANDQRQWYGEAKIILEEQLLMRFAFFPTNIVVLAHDEVKDHEKTKELVRQVAAVGKLGRNIGSQYGELYRINIKQDPQKPGQILRVLQTQPDTLWPASSGINAPNPCWPTYDSLWANYKPLKVG